MKDRIRQIMEAQHLTQQSFALFLGMSAASLSSIFNGRTKPTLNTVEAIKAKIPNVSMDWLIFGRGEMYETQNTPQLADQNQPGASMAEEQVLDFSSGSGDTLFPSTQQPQSQRISSQQPKEIIRQEVKYIDKPQRKITEIRVFYDDQTYDTFEPKK
jgi:transcriptional regulator with XRE-family HTH domain